MSQIILTPENDYIKLALYIHQKMGHKILLVCGQSFLKTKTYQYLKDYTDKNEVKLIHFSDFHPNPDHSSVVRGGEAAHCEDCDSIIAAGGGSAIDVAKCIRHDTGIEHLLAVPTTAGSGSEATHFAVVYYQGVKKSVDCGIPDAVLLDSSTLDSLPNYQRKATMLDALCHGIESFWSGNSTHESMLHSKEAIRSIMDNWEAYLQNRPAGNAGMLRAAHRAGQAINLAQTTAGHAMSYQLTKRYGIAHGHAAALCVAKLWPYMLDHMDQCIDARGLGYLETVLSAIAKAMGGQSAEDGPGQFQSILGGLDLEAPVCSREELPALAAGVDPVRLKNFPISLTVKDIEGLYRQILVERG